jgi:DNA polymerase III epsilon subunit family exonuclease
MKKIAYKKSLVPATNRKYYRGPMFAEPGEVGPLFGYCSFEVDVEISSNFTIIDLETSGLSAKNSRVLEIAILTIDSSGNILHTFETLLNPEDGEVGRSDIHQISLKMLQNAPTFADVAENIANLLSGTIAVAHNAKFEENFLHAEFKRLGIALPIMPAIDTMWIAQMKLDLSNYKLDTVARHFGVSIENAHTALGDISAMQKFFPQLMNLAPETRFPVDLTSVTKFPMQTQTITRNQAI